MPADQKPFKRKPQYDKPKESPTGKLPPHDTELEEVVIGALMLEKDAYMNVADILTTDAFYDPVNAKIYEAISTLGLTSPTPPPACIRPPTSCTTPRLSRRSIWRAGS